jgi:hypothetical protein
MPLEFAPNERIVFRATLSQRHWTRMRCVRCSTSCALSILGLPFVLPYWLCGRSCREEEANSFELVVTNLNIHFTQKVYDTGMCCQNTGNKIIPLDKIQDIALVSDCCGDTCGFVDNPGDPYQLHIQTAGFGMALPELSVFCIEQPRELKRIILDAKQRVVHETNITGQSKTVQVESVADTRDQQERLIRVLELLERQLADKVVKETNV